MPHMCGVVTASTALVATAASAAEPPARSMATPADDGQVVDRAHHAVGRVVRRVRAGLEHRRARYRPE